MNYNFEQFPALESQLLSLVQLDENHKGDLFRLLTIPEVTRYFPVIPIAKENDLLKKIAYFKQQFNEGSGMRWGITLKGQQSVIGTIGFSSIIPHHKASIVYALHPAHQRKGLVTEALGALLHFGFIDLGLRRIEAEVMPGNTASERLLEKLGFKYEGLLQQWMNWEGKYCDIKMFALLNEQAVF